MRIRQGYGPKILICVLFFLREANAICTLFLCKLEISFDAYKIGDDRLREVRTYTEITAL